MLRMTILQSPGQDRNLRAKYSTFYHPSSKNISGLLLMISSSFFLSILSVSEFSISSSSISSVSFAWIAMSICSINSLFSIFIISILILSVRSSRSILLLFLIFTAPEPIQFSAETRDKRHHVFDQFFLNGFFMSLVPDDYDPDTFVIKSRFKIMKQTQTSSICPYMSP